MKSKRWFLEALMVVALFSWVLGPQVSQASSVTFDFTIFQMESDNGIFLSGESWTRSVGVIASGNLLATPLSPGLFSQQIIGATQYWGTCVHSVASNTHYVNVGDVAYYSDFYLDQSGPLRFTDLTWEVKMLLDGSETTLFAVSADADLITNGGYRLGGGTTSILASLFGSGTVPTMLSVTGHVIDTTAPVPLPPTVLLLGSGLLGLAGWRRLRKG